MLHRPENAAFCVEGHNLPALRRIFEWLRRHKWKILPLDSIVELARGGQPIHPKTIALTIDDGYLDQYELSTLLLDPFDAPATFYVATDFLDGKLWLWDAQVANAFKNAAKDALVYCPYNDPKHELRLRLSTEADRFKAVQTVQEALKRYPSENIYSEVVRIHSLTGADYPSTIPLEHRAMSWANARALIRRGHSVQPHTCTHRMLTGLPPPDAKSEIERSWKAVQENTLKTPSSFAYPNGRVCDYSQAYLKTLSELGCTMAVTTVATHATLTLLSEASALEIPRYGMPDDLAVFAQYASWIERIKYFVRNRD